MALIDQIQIDNKYFQLDLHRDSEINSLIYLAHWYENGLFNETKHLWYHLATFYETEDLGAGNLMQIHGTLGNFSKPQTYYIEIGTRDGLYIRGFYYFAFIDGSMPEFIVAQSKNNPKVYSLFLHNVPRNYASIDCQVLGGERILRNISKNLPIALEGLPTDFTEIWSSGKDTQKYLKPLEKFVVGKTLYL